MNDLLNDLLATLLFAVLGMGLLALGYAVVDLLTPGHLGRKVFVDHNRDASLVLGSSLLALGGIIATSIYTTESDTWHTLLEAGAHGLIGIVLLGVAFLVLDLATPGRLGDLVTDEKDDPAVWVIVASQFAVGLIIAASLT